MGLLGARSWLQKNIDSSFWVRFHNWGVQQNIIYRQKIEAVSAAWSLGPAVSFLKHLSYKGAIRLPEWCPDDWESWRCPRSGKRYADLTNELYLEFMKYVWPTALRDLGISNAVTAGDLLEALLGWYYALKVENGSDSGMTADDFIAMLEQGALCMYALREVE
jgi:hypothetical protein